MYRKLLICAFFALLAYLANEYLRRHWLFIYPHPSDFQHTAKIIERPIPTTYYDIDKLGDVLTTWDDSFQLYRVRDGQKFEFDYMNTIKFPVLAHRIPEKMRPQSTLCSPPFHIHEPPVEKNTTDIFSDPGWYASFAKMSPKDAETMFNLLKLPFSVSESEKEHGFISNFNKPMLTSPIHATPMVLSMAVQLIGSKSWVFVKPDDYRGDDMWSAMPVASTMRPQRVPKGEFEVWFYTSQPGDVLFFPESWGHIVYTHPGPCVLMNYRNLIPNNFLRQPITYMTALLNQLLFGRPPTQKTDKNEWPAPEMRFNQEIAKRIDDALCSNNSLTPFDKSMLDYIRKKTGDA
mmetsp:Transcript_4788/g.7286  ORF Transcript_4788/g.7286 Transcript_4788/m.7286 type:complete len:347 (-) Transcript_4788:168-1208(-)